MYHTQKCFESIASDITMSNLSNTPGGSGLPDRFRNVGDQIQKFFDFAETDPDRAVPFFVNIWETQGSLTTRALALQGLGRAAQHGHVKQALADWEVLKDIAKEVKGKGEVSSDLTRWAAAKALEDIGYSLNDLQHLEGGGFTESLDRIRREIRDRKLAEINRIQRLNTRRETTAEYERNLEFWVYGPVEELFAGNDHSPNYQELVKDVIRELHGRGVYLGLISPNLLVQAEALLQAGPIFKESAEIENFLYKFLEEFLHNPNQEISFRINAAEIIYTARDLNRSLKTLSKLLLEEKNPKLQEVVLRQAQSLFKQSAETEKILYQPLEEFLGNPNRETSLRITAAHIINTASDLSRKLKTLSQLLLENTELRNLAVRLLTPYKQELVRVDSDAYVILETFAFNYSLHKPELQDLTIAQIEAHISSTNQYQTEILSKFSQAIDATESLANRHKKSASILKGFFLNNQNEYLSDIQNLIDKARYNINEMYTLKSKINSNQDLLKKVAIEQSIQTIVLYSVISSKLLTSTRYIYEQLDSWNNVECQTNNQYRILASKLKSVKDELKNTLISRKYELENTKEETYAVTILVLFLISLFISFFALGIYHRTIGGSGNIVFSVGIVIFLITFFILSIPPIIILNSRNKKKQKIMEVLKCLTDNWQE